MLKNFLLITSSLFLLISIAIYLLVKPVGNSGWSDEVNEQHRWVSASSGPSVREEMWELISANLLEYDQLSVGEKYEFQISDSIYQDKKVVFIPKKMKADGYYISAYQGESMEPTITSITKERFIGGLNYGESFRLKVVSDLRTGSQYISEAYLLQ